jgi:conjugative transfer pilus assembly protein TraH
MKFKKIIISVGMLLLSSNLFGGGMSDYASGVIQVEDSAGVISTSDRTLLYGGGYTLKVPNVQLTPFSIQAPNIKAGCGGIDMVFGSLGFLDKEQFVKFAEGIIASAPGVAFDLALKTVCPSCAETLKSLQSMANQINNMSLDSCSTASALGGMISDSSVFANTKDDLVNGSANSFFQGVNENYLTPATSGLAKVNDFLNGFSSGSTGTAPKIVKYLIQDSYPSFVDYFFKDTQYLGDNIMRTFLISTIGDIKIISLPSGENAGKWQGVESVSPLKEYYEANNHQIIPNSMKLINRLMGADDNKGFIYNSSYTTIDATTSNFPIGTLSNDFKTRVENIINKISSRTALASDDIKFLGLFKFPVYRIFNVLGGNPYTNEILIQSKDKLANMLASQLIYELSSTASRVIQMRLSELSTYQSELENLPVEGVSKQGANSSRVEEQLRRMSVEARYVANLSYVVYSKHFNEFTETFENKNNLIQKAKQLKQLAISRGNPRMIQQIMYVNSISPVK